MSTAPAGIGIFRSLRMVSAVRQIPPPAESPANTILEGGIALCGALGGGFMRYRSDIDLSDWRSKSKAWTYKQLERPAKHKARGIVVPFCEYDC